MTYCIWLSFHMNKKFLNVFQTSPFCPYCVPGIATWSYQTRGFHLLITSWHIFPVHHFTLAPFFAFSLICLSYINKSFVIKMSCLLPRAKLLRVTFFMKRSYLLPRENFKLPYLPKQAHWDPGIRLTNQKPGDHGNSAEHDSQGKSEGFDSCDRPGNLTQIGFKSSIFSLRDLGIWWMTSKNNKAPLLHQVLCIISNPSVNSNWSYSPKTLNSGQNWRFFCPVWPSNLVDDLGKQ